MNQTSLTERLHKINTNRSILKARVAKKSGRHQSISFDQAKLIRETIKAIKLETKIEKAGVAS